MIDVFFENVDQDKFINEYDNIISTLIEVSSQNFDDEKINTIYKILDIIVKFIDPLLDNLSKLQNLYSIFSSSELSNLYPSYSIVARKLK